MNKTLKVILIIIAAAVLLIVLVPTAIFVKLVTPIPGVVISENKVTDIKWGFSFPNTIPNLSLNTGTPDNPCNSIYCRQFNSGFGYTVSDIAEGGSSLVPDRYNKNNISIYKINGSDCFRNETKKYLLCFTPLLTKYDFIQRYSSSYPDAVIFYNQAIDNLSF
jgi:hypothetical protein